MNFWSSRTARRLGAGISRMLLNRCGRRNGVFPRNSISPFSENRLGWRRLKSYNEMLFMIDTCQANTMYSRFYTPNIIATGSSEIDQSSYSHHADNDVGVAVIDRWTYYNLEFLETQVTSPTSKLTLGNLFDSYDESKIHSKPGVRWDLFPGGAERGRERLVMDFFGNVQGVEVENVSNSTGDEFVEDMRRLKEILRRRQEDRRLVNESVFTPGLREQKDKYTRTNLSSTQPEIRDLGRKKRPLGAAKVESANGWTQQVMGLWALVGCALVWGAASWLETSHSPSWYVAVSTTERTPRSEGK